MSVQEVNQAFADSFQLDKPEGALVVNNGAAALVLATTALAAGGEVVVSRGELIEIGGHVPAVNPKWIRQIGIRSVDAGEKRLVHDAGIEVIRIAGSELGAGRGGPRCMSCPISRGPV